VAAEHARAEAGSEASRRASDRAFFVRPQRAAASELWAYGELRAWYGGDAGGSDDRALAGSDFAGPPVGAVSGCRPPWPDTECVLTGEWYAVP
jgi:hypothetical protein